jgi:hypothetical protein
METSLCQISDNQKIPNSYFILIENAILEKVSNCVLIFMTVNYHNFFLFSAVNRSTDVVFFKKFVVC